MVSCDRDSRQYIIISGSLVIITVSIICGALVSCKTGQKTRDLKQSVTPSSQWCLSCDVLVNKSNSKLMEKLDKVTVDNVSKCCDNNSEQASALVEMLTSPTEDDPEPLKTFDAGNFSLSRVSAHKRLTFSTLQSMDGPLFLVNENMKLEFEIRQYIDEHARNIEVKKSALVVLQGGKYFIYSSIFFRPFSDKQCRDLKKQTWEHNIILTRENDKESSGTIFSSTYTCCDNCIGHKETSYAGGLFDLKENDQLHVEVSSDGVVTFKKEGSYLGLFMVA